MAGAVFAASCGARTPLDAGLAGAAGASGASGVAGAPSQARSSKLDLLFMIDNSTSMAEKQALLADSVPALVQRLVTPRCAPPAGGSFVPGRGCPVGGPEFAPVTDLHIGVVTSSLGAHGGQVCTEARDDDRARLIATLRPNRVPPLASWNGAGFLAWDPDPAAPHHQPPGESDLARLTADFRDMIVAAGEAGCGYEASLEAWYRFLVDPDPPSQIDVVRDSAGVPVETSAVIDPPDDVLLAQRAAFLRPDSILAIVMMTDENDCSIVDYGQGWLIGLQELAGRAYRLPRARSACRTNPNDRCCVSCETIAPAGCGAAASDSECRLGYYGLNEDNPNLRCFDQKRRFGFDLLYPIDRYVAGLTEPTVPGRRVDAAGRVPLRPNPIFAGEPRRDRSLVFLAGIVGVPWQDLATGESLQGGGLEYLPWAELVAQDRWSLILGSPGGPNRASRPAGDALMVESVAARTALPPHPLLGAPIAPPDADVAANPINGRESSIEDGSDLQYACVFPLPEPRDCASMDTSCDCKPADQQYRRSVCRGTSQTHGKAYPSVRPLELLKAFGERTGNSIVASICPKSTRASDAAYAYEPAFDAIVQRLKERLAPAP